MRSRSHTFIGIIREHLLDWQKAMNWSNIALAIELVEAHKRASNDQKTEIRFEPRAPDPHTRAKVNMERIFRWLDETEGKNLLPLNFKSTVLAALPLDRRVRLLNDLYREFDVSVSARTTEPAEFVPALLLRSILKEVSEAKSAIAAMIDGITTRELFDAQNELREAILAMQNALASVDFELSSRTQNKTLGR